MKINSEKLGKLQGDKVENKTYSPKEIYELAYRFYEAGRYCDAEQFFRLLTSLEMGKPVHWMGLAACLQMQKKYQEAVDCYGAAALLDRRELDPLPHAYAASCLYLLGNITKAKHALNSAKKISKENRKHASLYEHLSFLENQWLTNGQDHG